MTDKEQLHIPANIEPYVEALGVDDAMRLFLSVGGSDIYLPRRSSPRSQAARTVGPDRVDKLAKVIGYGYIKVPLAKRWMAEVMKSQGVSTAEIARTIRTEVATVRKWFPSGSSTQLTLF